MILANKIKEYLEESGMTRKEFAEKAQIGVSTLNGILNGNIPNPTYITVMKIAQVAHISLDEIGGLTSKDMGAEEIARVRKEFEKNEAAIKQMLSDYESQLAHQEEEDSHKAEIIRRQDLRIAEQLDRMTEQLDRIAYQKKAIFLLRLGLAASILYAVMLDLMSPAIGFIQH